MKYMLRSVVLWMFGGTFYFLIEVLWKIFHNHPENISWTMLVLGIIVSIPLDLCNNSISWEMPLWLQAIWGGTYITISELISGLILNVWLKLNIWDYSNLYGNILGQICPQFTLLWILFAGIGIVMFDWLRYVLYGEERPYYKLKF